MLSNVICLFFLLYQVSLFNKWERFLECYCILSLVAPNLYLSNLVIPYYVAGFFPMIAGLVWLRYKQKNFSEIRIDKKAISVGIVSLLIVLVNVINMSLGYTDELFLVSWFAYFRFFIVVAIFLGGVNIDFKRIIKIVLVVNVVLCLYQTIFPEQVATFYGLYGKPSYVVWQGYMDSGYISRPCGTLLSPGMVGIFALLSFNYYLVCNPDDKVGLLLSIILGLMSMSKTAFVGIPFVFLFYMVCNPKYFMYGIGMVILALGIIGAYIFYFPEQIDRLEWYAQYIFDPLGTLATRYSNNGNLYDIVNALKDDWVNLFTGVGSAASLQALDSSYVTLIHSAGVVGLVCYLVFLWNMVTSKLLLCAILVSGLALPIFFNMMLVPFLFCSKEESSKSDI